MGIETNTNLKNVKSKKLQTNFRSTEPSEKNGLQDGHNLEKEPYVHYRVFGYSIGAAVHIGNIIAMALVLRGPIMKDPDVAYFYSMEFIYFTIWNLGFQLMYIAMGLVCDCSIILKMKNTPFLDWLTRYRRTFYNGILWPSGMVIFIIFWPMFIIDRSLLYPDYIEKVLSQVSNYIMHMFIVFPILWDLVFLPNQKPSSQKHILGHTIGLCFIYLIVLLGHYYRQGKWPYPILKLAYGTFYFPLIVIVLIIIAMVLYSVQWKLISFFWRNKSRNM